MPAHDNPIVHYAAGGCLALDCLVVRKGHVEGLEAFRVHKLDRIPGNREDLGLPLVDNRYVTFRVGRGDAGMAGVVEQGEPLDSRLGMPVLSRGGYVDRNDLARMVVDY